ncbi:TetR/AcrR family transcriptional regulator [Actinomadura rugatobispora]|uniref:TetR/AcrR family transcriptional regulator n=1 Tax=Actinomadura rugatobispora TaxID=1994 RepID=A0ABW1A702_9ACTN|nr:TetR/AcrR family transcriptional regulator [Actinomadura rugatobispora]
MARLTRAETQRRNRARVLEAAREEFAERGYRDAKIDAIAERAELTRGAVYSNFPGKRALYFAVLADLADREPAPPPGPGGTAGDALAAFARAWVARLPLATDQRHGAARLGMDVLPEIIADERLRKPFAQLMKLEAVLLGLCLERLGPPVPQHLPGGRMVRTAETALTTLQGAAQLAAAAPGFVEPFDIVGACRRLADLETDDRWPVPPIVARTRPAADPWSPPPPATDAFRGDPVPFTGDGVVAVLGLHRLAAAEEAVRAAPPGAEVTAVLVTGAPDELAPLVRLVLAEMRVCLRQAVPEEAWPRLRIVVDETGATAAAAGVTAVSDATETAVRIESGRIVARAEGFGACHAAATWGREAADRTAAGRESR